MISPNCCFYASTNIISDLLTQQFQDSNVTSLSYTLVSINSIFSVILFSILVDIFSIHILFPIEYFLLIFGTFLTVIITDNKHVYLLARAIYGLFGESTLCIQSKIITILISKDMQQTAYSLAFCFYMVGEGLSSLVLPHFNQLFECQLFLMSFQIFGFLICIYYSIKVYKLKQNNKQSAKQQFKQFIQDVKQININYFIILLPRIFYQVSKSCFDTRSSQAYQNILGINSQQSSNIILAQNITSAVAFVITSFLGLLYNCAHYLALFGSILGLLCYILFCFINNDAMAYSTSVILGLSFGMFSSNANALLVMQADNLGASALGLLFSVQYLLLSFIIPLSDKMGQQNEQYPGYMYISFLIITVVFVSYFVVRIQRQKSRQKSWDQIIII